MLFRRTGAYEPDSPYDPAPSPKVETYSHEVFRYSMEDFRARLGLADNPHEILTVHIEWDGSVEVQMTSR